MFSNLFKCTRGESILLVFSVRYDVKCGNCMHYQLPSTGMSHPKEIHCCKYHWNPLYISLVIRKY